MYSVLFILTFIRLLTSAELHLLPALTTDHSVCKVISQQSSEFTISLNYREIIRQCTLVKTLTECVVDPKTNNTTNSKN